MEYSTESCLHVYLPLFRDDGRPLRMCAIVNMDCWQRGQEADTLYLHLWRFMGVGKVSELALRR